MPRGNSNQEVRANMSDKEPQFLFFERDREEVPTVEEVWDEETEVEFDPNTAEPDKVVRGYDDAMEVLEEADDGEYLWVEEDQATAPIVSLCSRCDASVQTNSKERVKDKRSIHHISTGH